MKKLLLLLLLLAMLSGTGCADMGAKVKGEFGEPPYKLIALERAIHIEGDMGGSLFGFSGSLRGGASALFAFETKNGVHLLNIPVEKLNITFIESGEPTVGFFISYDPILESSPVEINGSAAIYLVKKYGKVFYIKIQRESFGKFIKLLDS